MKTSTLNMSQKLRITNSIYILHRAVLKPTLQSTVGEGWALSASTYNLVLPAFSLQRAQPPFAGKRQLIGLQPILLHHHIKPKQ